MAAENRGPLVKFESRVLQGIEAEVSAALAAPGGAEETGGILLGRWTARKILIDDFEPVPSEHRFGPAYVLSGDDLRQFQESVEWFRTQREPAGEIVGLYRSRISPGSDRDKEDQGWFERLLPGADCLVLVLREGVSGGLEAELQFSSKGSEMAASATPFPFQAPFGIPLLPVEPAAPEPPPAPGTPPPPPPSPPAREMFASLGAPRRPKPEAGRPSRPWVWPAILGVATLAAGLLGYASVDPPIPPPRPPVPGARKAVTPAPPAEPAADAPDPIPPVDSVRGTLDNWAEALTSGDADTVAAFYAPLVTRYFKKRNVTTAEVRRAVSDSLSRYGRPVILRLSGVSISPEGNGRATATFLKHWQTRGPGVFAGEEEERLGFARVGGEWKIDSEEELRVLWVQRPAAPRRGRR